jgi:hypothetical protein
MVVGRRKRLLTPSKLAARRQTLGHRPAPPAAAGGGLPRTHAELDSLAAEHGVDVSAAKTVADKQRLLTEAGVTA